MHADMDVADQLRKVASADGEAEHEDPPKYTPPTDVATHIAPNTQTRQVITTFVHGTFKMSNGRAAVATTNSSRRLTDLTPLAPGVELNDLYKTWRMLIRLHFNVRSQTSELLLVPTIMSGGQRISLHSMNWKGARTFIEEKDAQFEIWFTERKASVGAEESKSAATEQLPSKTDEQPATKSKRHQCVLQ